MPYENFTLSKMKLYFNGGRFHNDLFSDRTLYSVGTQHYRQTEVISWLEKNVEPMKEKVPGEGIKGETSKWSFKTNVGYAISYNAENSNSDPVKIMYWVEVENGILTEHQQLEFALRFL